MFKVHVSESRSPGTHLLMNTFAREFANHVCGAFSFVCLSKIQLLKCQTEDWKVCGGTHFHVTSKEIPRSFQLWSLNSREEEWLSLWRPDLILLFSWSLELAAQTSLSSDISPACLRMLNNLDWPSTYQKDFAVKALSKYNRANKIDFAH